MRPHTTTVDGAVNTKLVRTLMEEGFLSDADRSLGHYARSTQLDGPASDRLAFRELGLAIGMHGLESARDYAAGNPDLDVRFRRLLRHAPLAERSDKFWSDPANRRTAAWIEHADINGVMLAASLRPAGYFGFPQQTGSSNDGVRDRGS